MENKRKIILFLILFMFNIPLFCQLWSRSEFCLPMESTSYSMYIENRSDINWKEQKSLSIGGQLLRTTNKFKVGIGLSYWNHIKKHEIRNNQFLEYHGIRFMLEERSFINGDFKLRTRIRLQDNSVIYRNITLETSNEIFFQEGYEHNRLQFMWCLIMPKLVLKSGYLIYRGNQNFNALILTMIWKLNRL